MEPQGVAAIVGIEAIDMKAEYVSRDRREGQTVLVVADDPDILILVQAALAGKGYRVLVANGAQSAVRLLKLKHIAVHSVGICAGMRGCEQVQKWSLRRRARPWPMFGSVKDGIIRLKGLELGAAASDLRSNGRYEKVLAAR